MFVGAKQMRCDSEKEKKPHDRIDFVDFVRATKRTGEPSESVRRGPSGSGPEGSEKGTGGWRIDARRGEERRGEKRRGEERRREERSDGR